jgi:hypothetical protein
MTKTKYTYAKLQVALFAAVSLFSIDQAKAANIDHFSFCLNTCKAPHCDTASIKTDCKNKCKDEWKQVASLELSKENKEFRMSKDVKKKDDMLYGTKIAKCLDQTKETPKETPAEKPLVPAADPKEGNTNTITSKELCEAAIKHEMRALRSDQAELKIQEGNLASAVEHLNADVKKD